MDDADDAVLGLFPLGIVLLPGEVVPLHIFEERYKKLIRERVEEGELGIVLVDDDSVRECGTTARVAQVIQQTDEGEMDILVQGMRRFRIVEVLAPDDPDVDYLGATVEFYRDTEPEGSRPVREAVLDVYARMLELMDVEEPHEPAGEGPLSFRVAAAVDFGAQFKQELLESRSEEQRLEMLLTVITALLPRLQRRKEREDAIRGNGKGY